MAERLKDLNVHESVVKWLEVLLMLANDGLKYPDEISNVIACSEYLQVGLPRESCLTQCRQNFVDAPDDNVRNGNRTVLPGRCCARLFSNRDVFARRRAAGGQPESSQTLK